MTIEDPQDLPSCGCGSEHVERLAERNALDLDGWHHARSDARLNAAVEVDWDSGHVLQCLQAFRESLFLDRKVDCHLVEQRPQACTVGSPGESRPLAEGCQEALHLGEDVVRRER